MSSKKDYFYALDVAGRTKIVNDYFAKGETLADLARDLDVKYNTLYKSLLAAGIVTPIPKTVSDVKLNVYVGTKVSDILKKDLDKCCSANNVTRAVVIREAVVDYVRTHKK